MAAHRLVDLHVELAVREAGDVHGREREVDLARDPLAQLRVAGPGEQHQLPVGVRVTHGRGSSGRSRGCPALDVALAGPADRQGSLGDVPSDDAGGGDVRAASDPDRGHQAAVAADEDTVPDGGPVLGPAVVVAGDGAGTDVDVASHVAVEHAGGVVDVTARPDPTVLDLGMRSQRYPRFEHGIRTDPAVRSNPDAVTELAPRPDGTRRSPPRPRRERRAGPPSGRSRSSVPSWVDPVSMVMGWMTLSARQPAPPVPRRWSRGPRRSRPRASGHRVSGAGAPPRPRRAGVGR